MNLIHICPTCNKEHELDSVPEPSQLCSDCKNFNTFIDFNVKFLYSCFGCVEFVDFYCSFYCHIRTALLRMDLPADSFFGNGFQANRILDRWKTGASKEVGQGFMGF